MLQVFQYRKGKTILRNKDYVFSDYETFYKIYPYLLPKIEGTWIIAFLQIDLEDALTLENLISSNSVFNVELYLKKDILAKFIANRPTYKANSKSSWEMFNDLIAAFPKTMDDKVASELYSRCNRNLDLIKNNLEILADSELNHITVKDLNRLVPADNIIYPREIIMAAMFKNNSRLRNTHPRAKSFLYKNAIELSQKLEETSSRDYIYYSIRKFLRSLLDDKSKYLTHETVKFPDLVDALDYSEIVFMYLLFENNNPNLLYNNLIAIESRTMDLRTFESVYLLKGGY